MQQARDFCLSQVKPVAGSQSNQLVELFAQAFTA